MYVLIYLFIQSYYMELFRFGQPLCTEDDDGEIKLSSGLEPHHQSTIS